MPKTGTLLSCVFLLTMIYCLLCPEGTELMDDKYDEWGAYDPPGDETK
jgi:hypothetical protein